MLNRTNDNDTLYQTVFVLLFYRLFFLKKGICQICEQNTFFIIGEFSIFSLKLLLSITKCKKKRINSITEKIQMNSYNYRY